MTYKTLTENPEVTSNRMRHTGIIEERQKRPWLSVTPLDDEENVVNMNEAEVKAKLNEIDVKTRVENAEKLRQL